MVMKVMTAQRDFSAGEIDVTLKRDEDNAVYKAGLRQCSNFRILDSNKLANRCGRRALFVDGARIEEVLMSPGNVFFLVFGGDGSLRVRNSAGTTVFTTGTYLWRTATVGQIVWDIYGLAIYICFPGQQPIVLSWDGVSTWAATGYAVEVIGNQKRSPFYRIAPAGVTMQPSANYLQSWAHAIKLAPADIFAF